MSFAAIQAAYAAHKVATYPLTPDKTPAVKTYTRIGAPYSAQLAMKFRDFMVAGFCAGPRNRITVIDIDSTDPKLVDEIEHTFGPSPLHVLTPSGGRHLLYRHGGEQRRIRPLTDVDILGAGNVVCAGSETSKGRYVIERGSLDDLDRLPRLAASPAPPARRDVVPIGKRNSEVFKYAHCIVANCDKLDQLIDAVSTWADGWLAVGSHPVTEAEIIKTCTSVWTYRGGRRRIMNNIVEQPVWAALVADPEVLALFAYLSAENGPEAEFMIADGLGDARGWARRFVPTGRKALLDMGVVRCVREPRKGAPGLSRWGNPQGY